MTANLPIWTFVLNSRPLTKFSSDNGRVSYDAFSGNDANINRASSECVPNSGPIPTGRYYVVDRPTGGNAIINRLRQTISGTDRSTWFGLFKSDGRIDDRTFCNSVERGLFRLHPKGPLGLSNGCITIERLIDFHIIRDQILRGNKAKIPGSELEAYAIVNVVAAQVNDQ